MIAVHDYLPVGNVSNHEQRPIRLRIIFIAALKLHPDRNIIGKQIAVLNLNQLSVVIPEGVFRLKLQ